MKIKFSNFVKLFLAGASLLAVGCTDYGQDIQNLRDEVNDRFEELKAGTIDPLAARLAEVETSLKAAHEAITAQQLKHDEDVKALQDADKALQAAIDAAAEKAAADLAAEAQKLRDEDAALGSALRKELADGLDALSKNLSDYIKANDDRVAALEAKLAEEVQKAADALATVKSDLESADAKLKADLEAADTALAAALRAELAAESQKLSDMVDSKVEELNKALAASDKKNADAIAALQEALESTKALLQGEIADTKTELTQALAETKDELTGEIQKGDEAVTAALTEKINALETALNEKVLGVEEAMIKAVTDLDAKLTAQIAGIEGDLKALIAGLEKNLADLSGKVDEVESSLTDKINSVNNNLTDQINNVNSSLNTKIDGVEKSLTDLINLTNDSVAKNAAAIDALEAALKLTDETLKNEVARLEGVITAGDAANLAKILEVEQSLTNIINGHVDALNEAIAQNAAKINQNADAIKALDANVSKNIQELKDAIALTNEKVTKNAEDIEKLGKLLEEEIAKAIKKAEDDNAKLSEELYAYIKEQVKNLNSAIDSLRGDLNTHVDAFNTYKAQTDAVLAGLQAQIDKLVEKDAEIEQALSDLAARVTINEGLIAENAAAIIANANKIQENGDKIQQNADEIKKNAELFEQYKLTTNKTLDELKAADVALASSIEALDLKLENYKKEIEDELAKHYGEFAAYQAKVEADFEKVNNTLEVQKAMIEANQSAIAKNAADIAALTAKHAEDYAKLLDEIKKGDEAVTLAMTTLINNLDDKYLNITNGLDKRLGDLETAHNELAAAHQTLVNQFEAYKTEVANTIATLKAEQLVVDQNQNAKIELNAEQIAALDAAVKVLDAKIDSVKSELEAAITALDQKLDEKVKELKDDLDALKGRIQSLVFVPEHVDGAATVHYAMLGNTLVEGRSTILYQVYPANCAAAVKKEDLKFVFTGELATSRANAPEFTVVDAQTVPGKEGVVAVTFDARNLSDEFYAGKVKYAVSLVLTTDLVNIASSYVNLAPATADQLDVKLINVNEDRIRIEYTDIVSKHVVLPKHTYEFSVNGKGAYDIDTIREMGYEVTVVKADPTYEFLHFDTSAPNIFLYEVDKTNPDLNFVTVSLKEVNKAAVAGLGTVKYSYDVCGKTLTAEGQVQVVKIQTLMTLAPQTITWTRSLDNEADGITPKVPTNRVVTTTAGQLLHPNKDAEGNPILDENKQPTYTVVTTTSYADIVGVTPSSVKINGQDMATPFNVVFGGTNDAPTVDFSGFAWGTNDEHKKYEIVATFDLSEMSVTMDVTLETVQNTDVVNLAEQTITWNYAEDRTSTLDPAHSDYKPTFRAVATTADNADLYANVIANGNLVSVDVQPAANVVFTATGLEATGFAWNESYSVKAVYALEDKLVTVNAAVNTVKAAFTDLVINLVPEQWLLTKSFDNQSETAVESLAAYKFDDGKGLVEALGNLGDITAADYLKDIFVTYPGNEVYTVNTVVVNKDNKTNLVINSNGANIKSVYNIGDFSTVPEKVDYQLVVTTWYGQKITFNKTLNIGLKPVNITLPAEPWKLYKGFVNTSSTAPEALEGIHTQLAGVTVDSNFAAVDFLKAIFVSHPQTATTTANGVDAAVSKLVVADDGQTINAVYDMVEYPTTLDQVDYTYSYKTWYGQEINISKTLTLGVETKKLALDDVVGENAKHVAQNLDFVTEPESIAALHDAVKHQLTGEYETNATSYLTDVLVDATNTTTGYYSYAVNANTVNGSEKTNSKLSFVNGVDVQVRYLYSEFSATPQYLEYVYDVTTWYGQQFIITKKVEINKDIRTYDFEYVPTWVFTNPYKSVITPEYTLAPGGGATAFSLESIKLSDAFLVKDLVAKKTLTEAELNALGITLEYEIEDAHIPSSLLDVLSHVFTYKVKDEYVNVAGHLKLATGIAGEVIDLPTRFSVEDPVHNHDYVDYKIYGHNPIATSFELKDTDENGEDLKITYLADAKIYPISVWAHLGIKDKRGYDLFENGAWVIGNGTNGFAAPISGVVFKPCDVSLYNATMKFEILEIVNLPVEQTGKVAITPDTGILTFDYTNKFMAAKPIEVKVKITLEHEYGQSVYHTFVYKFQTL